MPKSTTLNTRSHIIIICNKCVNNFKYIQKKVNKETRDALASMRLKNLSGSKALLQFSYSIFFPLLQIYPTKQ